MFEEQLERLKKVAGTPTDTGFAKYLGIRQGAISGAKKRKKIPDRWFFLISEKTGESVDWLKRGYGERSAGIEKKDIQISQRKKPKISELLTKAAEILESETKYEEALSSSIEAFYTSMKLVDKEKATLKTEVDNMKRENHDLKMQCLACENKDEVQQTA